MKKILGLLLFLMVFGFSSVAGAYSTSFTFIDGTLHLDVAENCEKVTLTTNLFAGYADDLVIDVAYDMPTEEMTLEYIASIDVELKLFNIFPVELSMTDLNMGSMGAIDPTSLPSTAQTLSGNQRIDAAFSGYEMTDVLFEYNLTITPDEDIDDRYAIHIENLSISEGNTSEMFYGILAELTGSGMVPAGVDLTPPFWLEAGLTGAIDVQANPVPVPGAVWLLGAGLIGLAGVRRRK